MQFKRKEVVADKMTKILKHPPINKKQQGVRYEYSRS